MAIILGIDPGYCVTGFGIIDAKLEKYHYIASGCIRLQRLRPDEKMQKIFVSLTAMINKYQPDTVAIEQIFMHRNPSSAIKLGQARGVAIVSVAQAGLLLAEYSAKQIKQAVTGYGAAEKTQVQQMVQVLLNLSGRPQSDAADALAIAICHANSDRGFAKTLSIKGLSKGRIR